METYQAVSMSSSSINFEVLGFCMLFVAKIQNLISVMTKNIALCAVQSANRKTELLFLLWISQKMCKQSVNWNQCYFSCYDKTFS